MIGLRELNVPVAPPHTHVIDTGITILCNKAPFTIAAPIYAAAITIDGLTKISLVMMMMMMSLPYVYDLAFNSPFLPMQ